jgi:hypothetical protein
MREAGIVSIGGIAMAYRGTPSFDRDMMPQLTMSKSA